MQTSEPCFDNEMIHWHILTLELQRGARGLSLPDGVQRAIDVVPAEVRHQLGLQYCSDGLMDLGSDEDVTLDHEDEWWRIDDFQNRLWEHRESVEFFDLMFDGLLERCIMPEKDQRILFDSFRQRLGLHSTDQPLAPRLRKVQSEWTTAPLEPLCEDVIGNAILHPERIVHRTAMWYFAGSKSRDPAVAPLVLDALDALKDSDDRKFAAACLKRLLISDAAAERILKLLQSHEVAENDSEDDEDEERRQPLRARNQQSAKQRLRRSFDSGGPHNANHELNPKDGSQRTVREWREVQKVLSKKTVTCIVMHGGFPEVGTPAGSSGGSVRRRFSRHDAATIDSAPATAPIGRASPTPTPTATQSTTVIALMPPVLNSHGCVAATGDSLTAIKTVAKFLRTKSSGKRLRPAEAKQIQSLKSLSVRCLERQINADRHR